MKNFAPLILLFVLFAFLTSGCFYMADVNPDQVGVITEKNAISKIVGPGMYNGGFYEEIAVIYVGTMTFSVEDPEVLTKDDQAVGLRVTIQARRLNDDASIKNLVTNWSTLKQDSILVETVSSIAREGMKNGVRGYTLPELLNDRNGLANAILEQVKEDSVKFSVEIVNVTVENVAPSAEYMSILSATANLKAQIEQEIQRQKLIQQTAANNIYQAQESKKVLDAELLKQQAQTLIDIEIAEREGKKTAAAQEVYSLNPQAFELARLDKLKELFGVGTVYFLPAGTDPTLFFNNGQFIPVP